jgi:hypothetical protein
LALISEFGAETDHEFAPGARGAVRVHAWLFRVAGGHAMGIAANQVTAASPERLSPGRRTGAKAWRPTGRNMALQE